MKKEIKFSINVETLTALDKFVAEQKLEGANVNRSTVIERAIKDQLQVFDIKPSGIVLGQ